jgi:transposase
MRPAAVPVTLTASERKILKKRVRGAKTPYRDRLRAQIALQAACGRDNTRIAADLGVSVNTVRKWRGRLAGRGLAGLKDMSRSGRPRVISEADRAAVVALACQLPADTGVPLSRWTGPELKRELDAQALASASVSVSSLLRILAFDPVKPWRYQSWIFPRDPDFAAKAALILDLYQGFYQGKPLGPDDRILSFDAKPSIQARGRVHAMLPAAPGRAGRAYRPGVRLHPEDHGNRPVHGSRRPGHGPAGVQERAAGDFPSLERLSETLLAFVDRYNQTARPFNWGYTAADLKDLLRRISEHEKQDTVR